MKKTLVLFSSLFLLTFALPQSLQAQCPQNADSNPCFALPSGSCVTYSNGKLRFWVASQIITKAQSAMDAEYDLSFGQYLQKYYRTDEMSITYMGGSWGSGQSFRVQLGGCIVIILMDQV